MIGVVTVDEFKPHTLEVVEHIFKQYNQPIRYIYHPFSKAYLDSQIVDCDKVLLCGKNVLKLFFKINKLEDAEMVQLWNNKCFVYTPDPNDLNKHPDNFRFLHDHIDFLCNISSQQECIPAPKDYEYINSINMLELMIGDILAINPKFLVLDIETTGRKLHEDFVRLIGIAASPTRLYVIPTALLNNQAFKDKLKEFMEMPEINWVGHNINFFDAVWMRHKYNINIRPAFDSMLAHYALDERQGVHSLDYVVAGLFYIQTWKGMIEDYATAPEKLLIDYLTLDLHFQYKIVEPLNTDMQSIAGLEPLHDNLLLPASHVFGKSYQRGALVDVEYLEQLDAIHERDITQMTEELYELVGEELNVNSWQQVNKLLYTTLGLPKQPSTKAGVSCTDEISLKKLQHPVAEKIMEVRRYQGINGKYVKGLLERVELDGRLRPSFKLHGTGTGRLSCSDPNLFNIPSSYHDWWRDEFDIKKAFIAKPGNILVEADESQIELRITAWFSRDEFLTNAYVNNEDVHTLVAMMCYNVTRDLVTKTMRSASKKVDFGAIYKIGAAALAEQLMMMGIFLTTEEVKTLQDNFLRPLVGFNKWCKQQYNFVQQHHYVDTPMGRRRRFPYINNNNLHTIKRQAVNTPIQSLAADMVTTSVIDLDRNLPQEVELHWTVYDSILMEMPEEMLPEIVPVITESMTQKSHLIEDRVPFAIDIKYGKNWSEMKEWKV